MKLERIKLESSNRKCKVTVEVGKLLLKIERSKLPENKQLWFPTSCSFQLPIPTSRIPFHRIRKFRNRSVQFYECEMNTIMSRLSLSIISVVFVIFIIILPLDVSEQLCEVKIIVFIMKQTCHLFLDKTNVISIINTEVIDISYELVSKS